MKKNSILPFITFAIALVLMTGCGQKAELIDLNKVLDIMAATIQEIEQGTPASDANVNLDSIRPIENEYEAAGYNEQFLSRFWTNLNRANLITSTIGVGLLKTGAIEGYIDKNTNNTRDSGEKQLFTIEYDPEGKRLIATDTQNQYRRDHRYRGSGLLTGYLIGSMLGRQRASGIKPTRFSNMKMSNKNYHKTATSRSSARSKGSSRSFRSGK